MPSVSRKQQYKSCDEYLKTDDNISVQIALIRDMVVFCGYEIEVSFVIQRLYKTDEMYLYTHKPAMNTFFGSQKPVNIKIFPIAVFSET